MSLLLGAALLMQDKSAEETFKKIEERIERAKTLDVKFKFELSVTGAKSTSQGGGSLTLKEGNKFKVTGFRSGQKDEFEMVSDGKKMLRTPFGDSTPTETPANLGRLITGGLARLGIAKPFFFPSLMDGKRDDKEETDP